MSAGIVVVALGGNAIVGPDGDGPEVQQAAVSEASRRLAPQIAGAERRYVITHGNGPQVGNLLVKNQLASHVVPPVGLDWCVAQTQATLGYLLTDALERDLREQGAPHAVIPVITRVLVDAADPAFAAPSKPVGRFGTAADAEAGRARGEHWREFERRGWRRVVASPEPLEVLDLPTIRRLVDDGAVVIAAGGGGIPMIGTAEGRCGVEAVLDKDLTAALLATALGAERLVIVTDVPGVAVDFGTADERWLRQVGAGELEEHERRGAFGAGSMGPKVRAALRFVAAGGGQAVIASLEDLGEALAGRAGTVVERAGSPA